VSQGTPPEPPGFPGAAAGPTDAGAGLSGPEHHLRDLQERLRSSNADLYRHLALYLQVLRQVLPVRVERAVFHLATQLQPRRYSGLPPEDRRQLHRRLAALVHRCTSLLTVEQLVSLAAQMARERERQERRERHRLLQSFASSSGQDESLALSSLTQADLPLPAGAPSGPGSGRIDSGPLPEGSVDLDGGRPFSTSLLQSLLAAIPSGSEANRGTLAGFRDLAQAGFDVGTTADRTELQEQGQEVPANHLKEEHEEDSHEEDSYEEDSHEEMNEESQVNNGLQDGQENHGEDLALPPLSSLAGMPLPPLLQRLMGESSQHSRAHDPWQDARLPDDPLLLLRWLEGVEQALARRLRNLSHAINVELLRTGLSGTLLPVSLLDGVLGGQVEVQPAPPNLLRLQLPFPAEDASSLVVMAVLLRSVDLELEEPRLRTCRRRLQQHRQEVRRMAQQFRRLQRRREAHEAEQLWLQDRHASRNPPG